MAKGKLEICEMLHGNVRHIVKPSGVALCGGKPRGRSRWTQDAPTNLADFGDNATDGSTDCLLCKGVFDRDNDQRVGVRFVTRCQVVNNGVEWVVKAYDQNDQRFAEADYFTDEKADANATADDMESRGRRLYSERLNVEEVRRQLQAGDAKPTRYGCKLYDNAAGRRIFSARPPRAGDSIDVVFIRRDGWSLGASYDAAKAAEATWPAEWVYRLDLRTGDCAEY